MFICHVVIRPAVAQFLLAAQKIRRIALAGAGCNEDAFECAKGMEAETAGDADLGVLLATLYGVALGRPDLAIPLLTQALDDEPEHSIASVGLVTSLEACGRRVTRFWQGKTLFAHRKPA